MLSITNSGEIYFLDLILNNDFTLELYKNDVDVLSDSVLADFTLADFAGYAAKDIDGTSWTDAETNIDGKAEKTYADQTFYCSSGTQDIYGYLLLDGTNVVIGEKFSDVTTISGTEEVVVGLRFTLTGE